MKVLWFFLVAGLSFAYAQEESREQLQEIVLRGNFSREVNSGFQIISLLDSTLPSFYRPLGDLLQRETNLYFKQNGNAMVSSISLRGTTASQTGVYWNGISMNSTLNGQTDFNAFQGSGMDRIEVRRGGGSALLGNGAVGGAINISDDITYEAGHKLRLSADAGSFGHFAGQFKGNWSSEEFYAKLTLGGSVAENDYPFPGFELKNENGSYNNHYISGVVAYKLNEKHQLRLFANYQFNDRDLPRTITASSSENLVNKDIRTLLEWDYTGNRWSSALKTAILSEEYVYLFDKSDQENKSFGNGDRLVAKYDLTYYLKKGLLLRGGIDMEHSQGSGSSIEKTQRDDLTAYVQLHHEPLEDFSYNLNTRAGYSSAYDIPVIFSLDMAYGLREHWSLKAAISTNYRLPTFNDLYWNPGGNPDLDPETSTSGEFGVAYSHERIGFSLTSFYIKSKDMIQWQPSTGSIWSPVNIAESTNYGLELMVKGEKDLGNSHLGWRAFYDLTIARDDQLDNQLIYVPKHKANALLDFNWRTWGLNFNLEYIGEVYTTTTNTISLDDYLLSHFRISKVLLQKRLLINLQVNNVFDTKYQSVAYRPMPGRNFLLNINFNI